MSPDSPRFPWRERVSLMIADIEQIERFIGSMDVSAFVADTRTVFAVSYVFVRLGEAIGHIPDHIQSEFPEIEWRKARHFRNFMIHVYQDVDAARLYETARESIPPLKAGLQTILQKYPL